MTDTDSNSRDGFDPKLPWHVQVRRGGKWMTTETFAESADLIRFVGSLALPQEINVLHVPTMMDGTGSSFLRYAKMRGLMPVDLSAELYSERAEGPLQPHEPGGKYCVKMGCTGPTNSPLHNYEDPED